LIILNELVSDEIIQNIIKIWVVNSWR